MPLLWHNTPMSIKPTTILKLTLLGFFLVSIPLTIGLLSTVFQVDRLATQMQKTVQNSTQAVESGRLIASRALSMERSAGQFLVLRDEAILARYETQRIQLLQEIGRLVELPLDPALSERLQQLVAREERLYKKLQAPPVQQSPDEKNLVGTDRLSELVHPVPFEVTRMIAEESSAMHNQISHVRHLLLWQAAALIPLALFIGVIFSVLISRPLRRLGTAIRQLGAGHFNTAIEVVGPQDIRELGEQLDWLRRQLAALDEQKLQFLHHISHELKTPLAAIREGAGLLRDGIVGSISAEQLEVVKILHENSLQLQDQVESLLNFNLALAQERLPNEEPLDLATLIPVVVKKHQLAILAHNIFIVPRLQPVWVNGAREQLKTIIDNLLSNAIKYSADGGKVQIKLYQERQKAILDVIDEGTGVLAEDRPHLFEPFYQGRSPSHGSIQGTGLGLSIVKRYLRLHDGSIRLMETSQGAHFRVILPVTTMHIPNTDIQICTN
ncbi:MAG: HAMP domain-containing protein [Planctomycetia bacterium]|nr:HAMP domain-containing protein [Planctomycetia bacterium]